MDKVGADVTMVATGASADGIFRAGGLALVGARGSGKTTVGRLLAERAGRVFVDLDHEIERAEGRTIASIFAAESESGFREIEARTLREVVAAARGAVIASGGGVVLWEENRRALRSHGAVVWLAADAGTLVERLRAAPGDRPALTDRGMLGEVEEILGRRLALYREAADWTVNTAGRTPEDIATEVHAQWKARSRGEDVGFAGVPQAGA